MTTCPQTERPARENFSSTILRIVYVAGLSRFDTTSLWITKTVLIDLIALSLLCRSAAKAPSASRASAESISAPAGSSWPGVSTAISCRVESPNHSRLANEVRFVTESEPAPASKSGGIPSASVGVSVAFSAPSVTVAPSAAAAGAASACFSALPALFSHSKLYSGGFCTKRQPPSKLSNVDLPEPVHPITSNRLRPGSARRKSSVVEKSTSLRVRSPICLSCERSSERPSWTSEPISEKASA
mmetsp:Transcript_13423/g.30836  ORF Transcript_13423/g.30836 Transcript_13423/m.30836 type:complete len:243 (-) Transcript_13423:113-841(-)